MVDGRESTVNGRSHASGLLFDHRPLTMAY